MYGMASPSETDAVWPHLATSAVGGVGRPPPPPPQNGAHITHDNIQRGNERTDIESAIFVWTLDRQQHSPSSSFRSPLPSPFPGPKSAPCLSHFGILFTSRTRDGQFVKTHLLRASFSCDDERQRGMNREREGENGKLLAARARPCIACTADFILPHPETVHWGSP